MVSLKDTLEIEELDTAEASDSSAISDEDNDYEKEEGFSDEKEEMKTVEINVTKVILFLFI